MSRFSLTKLHSFAEVVKHVLAKVPSAPGARTVDRLSEQEGNCQGTFLHGRGGVVSRA